MPKLLDSTEWLRKKIAALKDDRYTIHIAALLHIYSCGLTLEEIAEKACMSLQTLYGLRNNAPFMRLVDTYKKEFSGEIRENILINTYDLEGYDLFASEFTMFDEILQTQIKVPLFTQLKKLSQSVKSRATYNIKIDKAEFMLFRRLFSFFILIEKYVPTLTSKALVEMKEIAQEIVWPALDMDGGEIDRILSRPLLARDERLRELRKRLNAVTQNRKSA
jgi:hypothetical protein